MPPELNLYLLKQGLNNGYDTHDSCIVVAATEAEARLITPNGDWSDFYSSWVRLDQIEQIGVTLIGAAAPDLTAGEIVIASFNAG
jgi:hypothetical protein